jgi:phenylacetate-CoA ligase
VYDWQRAQIESALGARVFSWYGQSERVVLAGECEHDSALHIFPEYGYTELLDDDDNVITEPGVPGEVIGTAFPTRGFPLIRYRTNDAAVYADGFCEHCRRQYRRFTRIEGRLQEFIVSAGGRPISMTAINMHSPVFDNVRQFRFYQDTPGKVALRIVPKDSYRPDSDAELIRTELAPKLGPDTELTAIELVPEIPPAANGKFRFLDQRLPIKLGDSA